MSLLEQKPSSKSIQSGILKETKISYLNIHADEEELQLLWHYLRESSMSEKNLMYLITVSYLQKNRGFSILYSNTFKIILSRYPSSPMLAKPYSN